jgi:predicted DNA-binding transcriptional regulator YafY
MDTRILETNESAGITATLDYAASARVPIMLVYEKPDEEPQHRLISPSEVWEAKDSSLILSAYDHGREEPRSFRLDRIIRTYDAPDVEYVEIERRQS